MHESSQFSVTGRSRKRLGAPAFTGALRARTFASVARPASSLSGFVHTMPGSAAPCKTITTDDCDIRIDHSRIDILTARTLGRLGDPSKKKGLCVNT